MHRPIKEITLYSNGDSRSLSTWSNVPYLFAQALERAGLKVNRVNIEAPQELNKIYNYFFFYLFRTVFRQKSSPTFYRSPFHRWIINKRIKKASVQFPHSDINLFLSYLFVNKYSSAPNVLWCDWTDRVVIERLGRKPAWFERWSLSQEDKVISAADIRYTMFPICKSHMEKVYGYEFRYLERNVVNTVYDKDYDIDDVISQRCNSKDILFIGNHRYKDAAIELIEAYRILKRLDSKLRLHIIGMTFSELPEALGDNDIFCYGYLHKEVANECDLYYKLLLSAKIFVNPASQWGGYSSTVEAMFYGCPVIVSPYDDFVENFGGEIDFGIYHTSGKLSDEIYAVLNMPTNDYRRMAKNGADRVKDYTWDNYVYHFLRDVVRD